MARTGRFGRMPRAAPDLTATIVAALREYAAKVDSNYVDAWKNGGNVDGKPVTDSRLMAHFKERRSELSKDDPLYDEWSNRIDQYTFAIDDSKMRVKYDNGKASDAQMAAFYQKWADKTPDNTEFDRQLLSAVGKFRAASAARGRGGSRGSGVSKFKTDIESIENNGPKQASAANDALVQFAINTGIMPSDAKSLADLDVSSGRAAELLDILKDGVDNGDPIVQGHIDILTRKLKAIDPKFTWANATSWFSQTFEKGAKGNQKGLDYLKGSKYSTKAWEEHFTNQKINVQFAATKVTGLGIENDAKANSDWLDAQLAAAHGNPYLEAAAFAEYNNKQAKVIGQLQKNQVGDYQDPLIIGLINEQRNFAAAQAGGTDKPQADWRDSVGGSTSQAGAQGSGGAQRYEYAKSTKMAIDLLDKGGWMQIDKDPTDPTGTKAVYVVRPKESLQGAGAILLPGAGIRDANGMMVPVYAVPTPVQMMTVDPGGSQIAVPSLKTDAQGKPIPIRNTDGSVKVDPTTKKPMFEETGDATGIEAVRSIDQSGNAYYIYRTRAKDGTYVLSLEPPVVPGAKAVPRIAPDGKSVILQITIDPTMVDPATGMVPTAKSAQQAAAAAPRVPSKYDASTGTLSRTQELAYYQVIQQKTDEYFKGKGIATKPPAGYTMPTPQLPPAERTRIEAEAKAQIESSYHVTIPERATPAATLPGYTGGATAGPAALLATYPGYDATKFIDTTATNVDPLTGELHSGYYRSTLGLSLAHEFNVLKPTDPDYQKRLSSLTLQVQGGENTIRGMFQAAQKRGDQGEMTRVMGELNMWTHDKVNLATEVSKATNMTVDPASLLTSPMNPLNQFLGMLPNGTVTSSKTGMPLQLQSSEAISKFALNDATDRFDKTGPFGGITLPGQTNSMGRPGTATDPRELKLPGLEGVPFLKPLLDFVKGAGVPQLAATGAPVNPPGIPVGPTTVGIPTVAGPTRKLAGPTAAIKPPDAPKPIEPKPPEPTPVDPYLPPPGTTVLPSRIGLTGTHIGGGGPQRD